MMPYTCIVQDAQGKIETRLIYGQFGAADTAEDKIKEESPDSRVLAAIPGDHVSKVWLGDDMRERRRRRSKSMEVDIWDLDT